MYEKFIKLKEDKPWLFYLLFLPFLLIAAYEMYNRYLVNSGKKIVEEAEKKDGELKKEQDKAEAGAEYHKEEADKKEKEIKEDVDKDWHLK